MVMQISIQFYSVVSYNIICDYPLAPLLVIYIMYLSDAYVDRTADDLILANTVATNYIAKWPPTIATASS